MDRVRTRKQLWNTIGKDHGSKKLKISIMDEIGMELDIEMLQFYRVMIRKFKILVKNMNVYST